MARLKLLILSTVLLAIPTLLRAQDMIVPAGTILQCTLTEANLSSKTVAVEDPILCDAGSIRQFGVSVFPRGAYIGGRVAEYRDPGHFWGKGSMQLNFDRILLPGGTELPLSSKVISAPKLKVDSEGRIQGGGHAKRDAVEWMIPVLWPAKILTLPGRGPRPALKGESRLTLRLMQDIVIPEGAAGFGPTRPLLKPSAERKSPQGFEQSLRQAISTLFEGAAQELSSMFDDTPETKTAAVDSRQEPAPENVTFLVLKDGGGQLVSRYWVESGQRIRFVSVDGKQGLLPIKNLDVGRTVKLNRERGVEFVVNGNAGEIQ